MSNVDAPPGYEICTMPDGEFAGVIGPLFIRHTEARTRFAFRAASKHTNARGVVHGGVLMSFADQALGLTIQRAVGNVNVETASLNSIWFPAPGRATWSRAKRRQRTSPDG